MSNPTISGDVVWKLWQGLTGTLDAKRHIFDRTMRVPHGKISDWVHVSAKFRRKISEIDDRIKSMPTSITPEQISAGVATPEAQLSALHSQRQALVEIFEDNFLSTYSGVDPGLATVPDVQLLSERAPVEKVIHKIIAAEVMFDNNLFLAETPNCSEHGIYGDCMKRIDSLDIVNVARAIRGLDPIGRRLSEDEFNTVVTTKTRGRSILHNQRLDGKLSLLREHATTETYSISRCRSTTIDVSADQIEDWSPFIPGLAESGKIHISSEVFNADRESWVHNALALYDHATKMSRFGNKAGGEFTNHSNHDNCPQCLIYGIRHDGVKTEEVAPLEKDKHAKKDSAGEETAAILPLPSWTDNVTGTISVSHKATHESFADQMLLSYTSLCPCVTCHFHFAVQERARYWLKQRLSYKFNIMNPYDTKWTVERSRLGQDNYASDLLAFTQLLDGLGSETFSKGDELASVIAQFAVLASASQLTKNLVHTSSGGGIKRHTNKAASSAKTGGSKDVVDPSSSSNPKSSAINGVIKPNAPRVQYNRPHNIGNVISSRSKTISHLNSYIILATFNAFASDCIIKTLTAEFEGAMRRVMTPKSQVSSDPKELTELAITIATGTVYDQVRRLKPYLLSTILTSLVESNERGFTPLSLDPKIFFKNDGVRTCLRNLTTEYGSAAEVIAQPSAIKMQIDNPEQRYSLIDELVSSSDHKVYPESLTHTEVLSKFISHGQESSSLSAPHDSGSKKSRLVVGGPSEHVLDTMFIMGCQMFAPNQQSYTSYANYFFNIRNSINAIQGKPQYPANDLLSNNVIFGSSVSNPENLWMTIIPLSSSIVENWHIPPKDRHVCTKSREKQFGARHNLWAKVNGNDELFNRSTLWIYKKLWKFAVKLQKQGRKLGVGADEPDIITLTDQQLIDMRGDYSDRIPRMLPSVLKAIDHEFSYQLKWERLIVLAKKEHTDREHLYGAFSMGIVPGGNETSWMRHATPAAQMQSFDSYLEALTVMCSQNPHYKSFVGYFWPIPQEVQTPGKGTMDICQWLLQQMWSWYFDQDKLDSLVSDTLLRDIQPRPTFAGSMSDAGHDISMTIALSRRAALYNEFLVESKVSKVLPAGDVWYMSREWMKEFWTALQQRAVTGSELLNKPNVPSPAD